MPGGDAAYWLSPRQLLVTSLPRRGQPTDQWSVRGVQALGVKNHLIRHKHNH